MKLQEARAQIIFDWLRDSGGKTTLTNGAISEALGLRIANTRIAEALSSLVDQGLISIERVAPHPKRNPSGRVVSIIEAEVF